MGNNISLTLRALKVLTAGDKIVQIFISENIFKDFNSKRNFENFTVYQNGCAIVFQNTGNICVI